MSRHEDIKRIAALSFADHVMETGKAKSWRLAKPGTGSYSFRVTWAPGVLTVSGDIGEGVYRVWPGFGTPWGAVDFVSKAGFDYLCEKSAFSREFDREASADHLVELAYEYLRNWDDRGRFESICEEYGGDPKVAYDRKEAARSLRDDSYLTAERVYEITGDSEAPTYSYTSDARWAYEAVKLWAKTMEAEEPLWHRAWRRVRREYFALRRELKAQKHFRPKLHVASGFGGSEFWVRRTRQYEGQERAWMAAVIPMRVLGLNLSHVGLWREQGSSQPVGRDNRDAQFKPFSGARRAA